MSRATRCCPTLTIAGVLFGELIGGAVVTETVFGRAGIGRLTEQAVANQDIPVLQAHRRPRRARVRRS